MQVIQPIKTHKLKIVASITLLILCITLYYICKIPVISYAYEPTLTRTGTTTLQADVATSLEIVLPATSTILSVTPTSEGAFTSTDLVVKVATDNPTGYTLTMTAASSSLSRSTAVNGDTPTIETLSSATTSTNAADFPNDRWGFRRVDGQFADTVYHPITTGAVNINTSGSPSNINDTSALNTINFATKLTNATMSGLYEVDLNFVAITNYVLPSTVYMQDFNAVIADSLAPGITYTTKDSRDNQDYTVAKLADGNVWMTKNLNLAGGTTIHNTDSNISAASYTLPNNMAKGGSEKRHYMVVNSGTTNCVNDNPCYSYYDIATATTIANNGVFDVAIPDGTNYPYSICPKEWKMPSINEATAFVAQYPTVAAASSTPANFIINGFYSMYSSFNTSTSYYWLSTITNNATLSSASLYHIKLSGNTVEANREAGSGNSMSVRCIYDRSMQNFSAADAAAMSEGQTITLVDNRDNKEYKVTKINGRVWMTQNLAFTGTQLTPQDSNVSENTTMTYYSLDSSDDSYANHCDSTNGLSNACIKDSGSADTGVFYNYYAASANTSDGTTSAALTSSICPKGWEIPSRDNIHSLAIYQDQNKLPLFTFPLSGYYFNGTFSSTDGHGSLYGALWSGTPTSNVAANTAYRLGTSADYTIGVGNVNKYGGHGVRCIFSGE